MCLNSCGPIFPFYNCLYMCTTFCVKFKIYVRLNITKQDTSYVFFVRESYRVQLFHQSLRVTAKTFTWKRNPGEQIVHDMEKLLLVKIVKLLESKYCTFVS